MKVKKITIQAESSNGETEEYVYEIPEHHAVKMTQFMGTKEQPDDEIPDIVNKVRNGLDMVSILIGPQPVLEIAYSSLSERVEGIIHQKL